MKEIRYKDGTVRHVYAGPGKKSSWRPSATLVFITVALAIVVLYHMGGGRG